MLHGSKHWIDPKPRHAWQDTHIPVRRSICQRNESPSPERTYREEINSRSDALGISGGCILPNWKFQVDHYRRIETLASSVRPAGGHDGSVDDARFLSQRLQDMIEPTGISSAQRRRRALLRHS
jgi:hypothetical protein